jgi:hypothetical protein
MINNRGMTVKDRIQESFDIARAIEGSQQDKKAFALRSIGVADFALEFGLITFEEWEGFLSEYFQIE